MTNSSDRPEIDERIVAATRAGLQEILEAARQTNDGMTTVTLPATAIDGLLGMLRDPADEEFWYRRHQFIVFFARSRGASMMHPADSL